MSYDVVGHIGKVHNQNSEIFFTWNERVLTLSAEYNRQTNQFSHGPWLSEDRDWNPDIQFQSVKFGNCNACLSCGPFGLRCRSCGQSYYMLHYIPHPTRFRVPLRGCNPIVLAMQARKPCWLPDDGIDFLRMLLWLQVPGNIQLHSFKTEDHLNTQIETIREGAGLEGISHVIDFITNPLPNNDGLYAIIENYDTYISRIIEE